MNLAAVIQKRELLSVRNSTEWVAWMYDKDRPRDLGGDDMARYEHVGMLGPYRSQLKAITAAEAAIEEGCLPAQ